eukprot:7744638-Lingulodinium_polyedra.AAC.1
MGLASDLVRRACAGDEKLERAKTRSTETPTCEEELPGDDDTPSASDDGDAAEESSRSRLGA